MHRAHKHSQRLSNSPCTARLYTPAHTFLLCCSHIFYWRPSLSNFILKDPVSLNLLIIFWTFCRHRKKPFCPLMTRISLKLLALNRYSCKRASQAKCNPSSRDSWKAAQMKYEENAIYLAFLKSSMLWQSHNFLLYQTSITKSLKFSHWQYFI